MQNVGPEAGVLFYEEHRRHCPPMTGPVEQKTHTGTFPTEQSMAGFLTVKTVDKGYIKKEE